MFFNLLVQNQYFNSSLKAIIILLFTFFQTELVTAQVDSNIINIQRLLQQSRSYQDRLKFSLQLSEELYKTTPSLALKYANESEQIALKLKSDSLLNRAHINKATAYLRLGNYPLALQLYFKSIKNAKKTGDSHALFSSYEMTGILFYFQNDNKKALEYFSKALEQLSIKGPESKKQIERKAYLLNNIGIIYDEDKIYSMSEYYFKEALNLANQLDNKELIATILTNQGTLFADQGKISLAYQLYNEGLALRKKNDNKWGLIKSYQALGKFYFNQKNYQSSEKYFKMVIDLAEDINSLYDQGISSSYLYQIYKQKGEYKNAFEALELNKKIDDTLYNEKQIREIRQLEMQFEFDFKQTEIEAKQREKNLYFLLTVVSLSLLLVISLLLFYLQRSRTRRAGLEQINLKAEKKNLEKDIELKDKELTTQVLQMVQKNELIDTIAEKLLEIKSQADPKSEIAIQKVISDLRSNLQPELLHEFKIRFQHIHEDFFTTLNKNFPNLSPSELRLCAFLKLNLTSKEISIITNISIKSIEIARTRLRKKLNLTGTDQNLVIFLSQLQTH